MSNIRVLIVDDSKLMRELFSKLILNLMTNVEVDTAENGHVALEMIGKSDYHIITLDLNMPIMNGLEFMKERKKRDIQIPTIIFSSIAHSGATWTMECLELGACEFLLKPNGATGINDLAEDLVRLIQSYGGTYANRRIKTPSLFSSASGTQVNKSEVKPLAPKPLSSITPAKIEPIKKEGKVDIIVIGISTGGPNALREVFRDINPNLQQPIVVVQHMPEGFTYEFALSLNNVCPLEVKEAQEGDILKPGRIFIAPGNKHVTVEKKALAAIIHLNDEPPCNGHRPSADVLFKSVAKEYGNNALGVIMTGMGRDGAKELAEMRRQGARTLGQDEESSIVYGMPRVAFEMGGVQEQVPLDDMAAKISMVCKQ